MGTCRHVSKILDYNEPFKSRQEVEEKIERILNLMEQGNWVRARYDARIFSNRLHKTIEIIMKADPDLEMSVVSKRLKKHHSKKLKNKETDD